jgi:prevent-host-death family protein
MTIVNIHEAKTQLSKLIKLVLEGEEVIIAKNNDPLVTIKPIEKKKKRKPGLLKGKIKIIGDWEEADNEVEKLLLESKIFPDEENLD